MSTCPNNICNTVYNHRYYPTRFNDYNVPWWAPNTCPFATFRQMGGAFPPMVGTSIAPIRRYDPIHGRYGDPGDATLKGYTKSGNTCAWGYFPAQIGDGQTACCSAFGECGVGDQRLT